MIIRDLVTLKELVRQVTHKYKDHEIKMYFKYEDMSRLEDFSISIESGEYSYNISNYLVDVFKIRDLTSQMVEGIDTFYLGDLSEYTLMLERVSIDGKDIFEDVLNGGYYNLWCAIFDMKMENEGLTNVIVNFVEDDKLITVRYFDKRHIVRLYVNLINQRLIVFNNSIDSLIKLGNLRVFSYSDDKRVISYDDYVKECLMLGYSMQLDSKVIDRG